MTLATFNGATSLVTLAVTGDVSVRALYSAWLRWAAANPEYLQAMDAQGGDVINPANGTYATVYVRLLNGWRVVAIGDTNLVDGVLMVDGGAAAPFVTAPGQVLLQFSSPILTESFATPGTSSAIADAVWGHASAVSLADRAGIAAAILRNKTVTDPVTGLMTVYADNGVDVLLQARLFEDASGTQAYRGQGAELRERLQ